MQSKGVKNRKQFRTATAPNQVVCVDQLVIPTPGFIPTHQGKPMTHRYVGATIFVDHFSDFTYIHLMKKLDGESTVKGKHTFERVCKSHSVTVQH